MESCSAKHKTSILLVKMHSPYTHIWIVAWVQLSSSSSSKRKGSSEGSMKEFLAGKEHTHTHVVEENMKGLYPIIFLSFNFWYQGFLVFPLNLAGKKFFFSMVYSELRKELHEPRFHVERIVRKKYLYSYPPVGTFG